MFHILIYAIAADVWRWEIRQGSVLVRCGTAPTEHAAKREANDLVNA